MICSGLILLLSYFTEKARVPTSKSTISTLSKGLRAPRTVAAHEPHGTLPSSKLAIAMALAVSLVSGDSAGTSFSEVAHATSGSSAASRRIEGFFIVLVRVG
jgi:hypothetical protein